MNILRRFITFVAMQATLWEYAKEFLAWLVIFVALYLALLF